LTPPIVAAFNPAGDNSLREWKRRAGEPLGALPSVVSTENPEAELRRVRKENRELQLRCEILKNGVHLQRSVVELYGTIQQIEPDYPLRTTTVRPPHGEEMVIVVACPSRFCARLWRRSTSAGNISREATGNSVTRGNAYTRPSRKRTARRDAAR
jgi:hypothetical protein